MEPGIRRLKLAGAAAIALLAIAGAWSNHFRNEFHFDDFHTIVNNPAIQSLSNVPRFFTDARLFSTMPDHQVWRPLVSASLAVDWALGGKTDRVWFHLSTFAWFLLQLTAMWGFFACVLERGKPHPANAYFALGGAALYGLHPAMTDTVNYIIQRGEVYAALGVVAALAAYARLPRLRRTGLYLLPALAGMLAKPTALVFPALVVAYAAIVERRSLARALRDAAPALGATLGMAALIVAMTPPSFQPGAASALLFRATQPLVAFHFFKTFFLPTELSADTDWSVVSSWLSTPAVAGYVFLAAVIAAAWRASRSAEWRPVAFGLAWFVLAFLPGALMPVAEVTNDHRMYLPFAGLALAAASAAKALLTRRSPELSPSSRWVRGAAVVAGLVFAVSGYAAYQRNEIWRTEESLWRDTIAKSPRNGRALMNYGLALMSRGDGAGALASFERAREFTPNYSFLEINFGIVNGMLNRPAEAERHFERAVLLAPGDSAPHFYYGRWLSEAGRTVDSLAHLETAARLNRYDAETRTLLAKLREAKREPETPEQYLQKSLEEYNGGRFENCIAAARAALTLRPGYAEAYNNIAAAHNAVGRWDEGIAAAREAVRLKPDYEIARNNLAWALSQKAKPR